MSWKHPLACSWTLLFTPGHHVDFLVCMYAHIIKFLNYGVINKNTYYQNEAILQIIILIISHLMNEWVIIG
jgi:hypothetical protein